MTVHQGTFDDLSALPSEYRTLETVHGVVIGTFVEVIPGTLYFATGGVKRRGIRVKQGTWFVYDAVNSKLRRPLFVAYDNAYNVERGFGTYAKGWGMLQLSTLHGLHSLAMADLAATRGLRVMEPGAYAAMNAKLCAVYDSGGSVFTRNKKICHAAAMVKRTREVTRPGSQILGFANAAATFAEQINTVTGDYRHIMTISTVVGQYMGAVLDVVRSERAKIDKIMALNTDALFDEENAHALYGIAKRLFETLVARPTTHVGDRASKDCVRAADLIRTALQSGEAGRSGASEGVRNLLGNVRDSLDLSLWQYDVAEVVALIAVPVRNKTPFTVEEWVALYARVKPLHDRIKSPFGSRFENDTALYDLTVNVGIAMSLTLAMTEHFDLATSVRKLAAVKTYLVDGMRCA